MKKALIILTSLLVIFIIGFIVFQQFTNTSQQNITNFEECAEAGNPVQESYPARCVTPDGRSFTQEVTTNSAEGAPTGSMHNLPVPEAVEKVRIHLAETENVDPENVVILEAIEQDWPNSCLGLADEDETCGQVITPGYRIKAVINSNEFVFRVNSNGTVIRREE